MASFFYLTPVLGGPGAPRYPVTDERQLIGRSELAHIALLEPTVSREHAAVFCTREGVKLEDLESKHGTYVNSKRISDKILKVGDIVVFGLSLVLRLEETDHPLDPPPTLAASEPETTVSLVETPRHRRPSDRGGGGRAAQVTVTRAAPAPSSNDIDRMREATLRARKLATVGARVSAMLPGTHRGLTDISASLRRGEDPQESLAQLDMIIARISELLGDCQIPRPRLEPLSLFDVARRAVATVMPEASQKDVELLLGVPADIDVLTDPSRLRSALIQLLRNAADASPRGSAVELGATADLERATLSITDTGKGIPADTLERVFDPFMTLKDDWQSLGMGLFEARATLAMLGGSLNLTSVEGEGTTVTLTLPLA